MCDTARFLAVAAAATLLACSGDVFVTPDAGADASVDGSACADLTFCDNKCGAGLADKCGASRDCGGCGEGRTCDGLTHLCSCTAIPLNVWCVKKCGLTKDNCGTSVDCGGCVVPKTCANNSCDTCVDDGQACNGKACGTAVNNCGQTVLCGGVCSGSCNNGVGHVARASDRRWIATTACAAIHRRSLARATCAAPSRATAACRSSAVASSGGPVAVESAPT